MIWNIKAIILFQVIKHSMFVDKDIHGFNLSLEHHNILSYFIATPVENELISVYKRYLPVTTLLPYFH